MQEQVAPEMARRQPKALRDRRQIRALPPRHLTALVRVPDPMEELIAQRALRVATAITLVTAMLSSDSGNRIFQPRCMSWSYRNRGKVQRMSMKNQINAVTLTVKDTSPQITYPRCDTGTNAPQGK